MFKRRRLLLLACGVPLILAGLVYAQQTPVPPATTRLPDGRILTLNGVTHGHGTQYWYGGTRWQRWLGSHVQPGAARLLGLNPAAYSAHPAGQDPDQLLFWATVSDQDHAARPNGPSPYYFRALLLDDDGCAYTQHVSGEEPVTGGWREHFQWSIWPRRSKQLRVRLFLVNSSKEQLGAPVAEWVIPNPAPPEAVALNSGPVPVEAEVGPLHVVLTRLERIPPPPSANPLDPFAPSDGLRAVFRVWESGHPAPNLRLSEVVLTDPTGNIYSWGQASSGHYSVTPKGELVAESHGVIPPHEYVSRLTVRLARSGDIDRDVLTPALSLPRTGSPVLRLDQTVLVKGEPVHFEQITQVTQPGKQSLFRIEYSTVKQGDRTFSVQQAVDERGRPLRDRGQSWSSAGGKASISLEAPPASRSARLTLRPFYSSPPKSQQQAEMIIRIPEPDSPSPSEADQEMRPPG